MLLAQRFYAAVQQYGERPALFDSKQGGGRLLSYIALWRRSEVLAVALLRRGVKSAERLAILAPPSVDAVVAFWAIQRVGAVAVFLNDRQTCEHIDFVLDHAGAKLILAQRCSLAALDELSPYRAGGRLLLIDTDALEFIPAPLLPAVDTDPADCRDPAVIVYTSGSTGLPKGVCLSHRNLATAAEADIGYYGISAGDRYLMLVPLHYVHGLQQLLIHLFSGAAVYFAADFVFSNRITRQLQDWRISGVSGAPYHINALIERGKLLHTALPSLRWLGVTGGALAPARIEQLRHCMPAVRICITYGQTESAPRITALQPHKVDAKPTSVGAAPAGIDVAVVDSAGRPLPVGEVGEVVVAGDNVMLGYWRDPQASRRVIDAEGRLWTGDLGRFDADGDLFLLGRRQAMIKTAGERIFPEEIERVLSGHHLVREAAVVGVADPLYGQRIEAHIVSAEAQHSDSDRRQQLQQIRDHCLQFLPLVRAPRHYHFRSSLPLTASGKVDRQALLAGD